MLRPNTSSSGQRLCRCWYAPGLRGVQLLARCLVRPCRCPLSNPLGGDGSLTSARNEKVSKDISKPHRIAAGGITFKGNTVLLVRYRHNNNSGTYLVGPGGALENNVNVIQAIIRETKEETGITVKPKQVVAIARPNVLWFQNDQSLDGL